MGAFWTQSDFDDHERVQLIRDANSGLTAIIALHSTHLGPGAGGTRFWHYDDPEDAMRDVLRLSRGMSYKNAMADLPMGGGKAVILADADRSKTSAMLASFGKAVEQLDGAYITAQDVGITEADMVEVAKQTDYVSGLPVEAAGQAGGDPGPSTAYGIYLGIKAAVQFRLGKESLRDVHIAIQGAGSVGGGLAKLLAKDGARLTLSDVHAKRVADLANQLGAQVASPDAIMQMECDVFSPNALGAILDEQGIEQLNTAIVAGGANNQFKRPEHGALLAQRDILYAPDYVINAGGIISVTVEYLDRQQGRQGSVQDVRSRIEKIPTRLMEIWQQSQSSGISSDVIADKMAQERIGR